MSSTETHRSSLLLQGHFHGRRVGFLDGLLAGLRVSISHHHSLLVGRGVGGNDLGLARVGFTVGLRDVGCEVDNK